MRKIKTMADIERVRRRNNIILGIVMIVLLIGSSLGYSLMSADSKSKNIVNEEGFDFVRDGGMWKLMIGDEVLSFRNLPSEVSDIEVNLDAQLGMYNGQPLYFVNPGEGVNEILGNVGRYILRYQESCIQGNSDDENQYIEAEGLNDSLDNHTESEDLANDIICKGDLPVKDCSSNLIVFETGDNTRIYSEGNCVFIVGDVIRGSDAFLYKLFGVTS